MTIDEAIRHCLRTAEVCTVKECAEVHKQIAKWLTDYKRLKSIETGEVRCGTCRHFQKNDSECAECYQYSFWEGK